jgi:low temperature requirement protein LtrA
MKWSHLIQSPQLWPADPRNHRRVTWMELFFDLIFVGAVAEVGIPLGSHYSPSGLFRYTFLFVLIWWAWSGHTLYSTRFNTDDLVHRLLILLQSFIAAVMAANARDALDSESSAGFGAAYAGMRLILVAQYLRARRLPETRALTTRYAIGFGVAAIIWIASALVDIPARYFLWTMALIIDFGTPWLARRHTLAFPPDATHFPERFGLFTIILLGEFVISVMHGIESQESWSFSAASTAFASMAFGFILWWWYFDVARNADERRIRTKKQAALFQVWNYAHLPLFLGIGIAGVGFRRAISLEADAHLSASETQILTAAVAVLMVALISMGATSDAAQKRCGLGNYLWPQYLIAALVVGLGHFGPFVPRAAFAAVLLVAAVAQAVLTQREVFMPKLVSRKAS